MATKKDPNEIVHLQVREGETVVYQSHAYGPRATLQVRRGDIGQVEGKFDEVDPQKVPDVATIPPAA